MNLFTIVAFEKSEDGYFNGLIQELSWDALCDLLPGRQCFSFSRFWKVNVSYESIWELSCWVINLLQIISFKNASKAVKWTQWTVARNTLPQELT